MGKCGKLSISKLYPVGRLGSFTRETKKNLTILTIYAPILVWSGLMAESSPSMKPLFFDRGTFFYCSASRQGPLAAIDESALMHDQVISDARGPQSPRIGETWREYWARDQSTNHSIVAIDGQQSVLKGVVLHS